MRSTRSRARLSQWIFIALFLLLGTGGYFWYQSKAGITTNSADLYNQTVTSGLAGQWTFDGADMNWSTANEVQDRTANNNDGDVGSAIDTSNMTGGKIGQAMKFNGVDEYVSIADNATLDVDASSDVTLSGWFNRVPTWTTSYDTTETSIDSMAIDSIHGVLYAGSNSAIIYRCVIATGCDASTDWTVSSDLPSINTDSLFLNLPTACFMRVRSMA